MRRVLCAVLVTAVLAACGGGGGGDDADDGDAAAASSSSTPADASSSSAPSDTGGGDPAPTGTQASSPPTTQDVAADQARAESIVLRPGDEPAGWVATAADGDDDESQYDRRYAECVGVPVEHVDPSFPEADGHDLSAPDEQFQASGSATVAPSVAAAQPLLAAYRDPDTPRCFAEVLEQVLLDAMAESGAPPGVTVDRPTFERLAFPAIGDEIEAFRLTMTLRGNGVVLQLYADAILVRADRVVLEHLFMGIVEPFPTAQSERLLRLMVDRV